MAILTVQESAELLKATANGVMADGSVSMYPLHARAILDVLQALATVTAERDAQRKLLERIQAHAWEDVNALPLVLELDLADLLDGKVTP